MQIVPRDAEGSHADNGWLKIKNPTYTRVEGRRANHIMGIWITASALASGSNSTAAKVVEAEITAVVNQSAGPKIRMFFESASVVINPEQIIEVLPTT